MNKRVRTMILMLGSDQDGERSSAAKMLVAELKKAGRDLHFLADLTDGIKPPPSYNSNPGADLYRGRTAAAWARDEEMVRELLERERRTVKDLRQQLQAERDKNRLLEAKLKNGGGPTRPTMTETDDFVEELLRASRYAEGHRYQQNASNARPGQAGWYDASQDHSWTNPFQPKQDQKAEPPPADDAHWNEICQWCFVAGMTFNLLGPKDRDFIMSLIERLNSNLSFKQLTWLIDIFERIKRVLSARGAI